MLSIDKCIHSMFQISYLHVFINGIKKLDKLFHIIIVITYLLNENDIL